MEVRAIGSATRHIAIGNQSVTVSIPMGQKKKKKRVHTQKQELDRGKAIVGGWRLSFLKG